MKLEAKQKLFEETPVPKAVASMAIPTMITMLVMVLYVMVDTFFIGQTKDPLQVAAVTLISPIYMIFTALGHMFGVGGSSAISRSLGRHDEKHAKQISSFCCYSALVVGILMTAVTFAGMDGILQIAGADADTWGHSKSYLCWVALGYPFTMLTTVFGNILRCEGASKESMFGNLLGSACNLVLDPILIFGFKWGIAGAAIATAIGNITAALYYLLYFRRKSTSLSIRPKDFHSGDGIAMDVITVGIPSTLNNILMSIATMILNVKLLEFGNTAVAAMGVANKINTLVVLLESGLCVGVQALIAYNYGAKNKKRLMEVFCFTAICAVVMGMILTSVLLIFRNSAIQIFLDDSEVIAYGSRMLTALLVTGPVIGLQFLCTNAIQGMGKATYSLILSICRQGIVYIPTLYILSNFFGLDGLMYSQAVADILTLIVAVVFFFDIYRKMEHEDPRKRKGGCIQDIYHGG